MVAFHDTPTLTGDLVRLRPFQDTDGDVLWAMVNDKEGRRLTGTHATFTRDAVDHWYSSRGGQPDRLDLAVASLANDTCVGEVVLNDLDPDNASCALRISLTGPDKYGRGYGSEAIRLLLRHAFETVGLHRIELEVYAFNTRAIHVYRQAGFTAEGVRRQALRWEGEFHDAAVMSVLAPEWRTRPDQHNHSLRTEEPDANE